MTNRNRALEKRQAITYNAVKSEYEKIAGIKLHNYNTESFYRFLKRIESEGLFEAFEGLKNNKDGE